MAVFALKHFSSTVGREVVLWWGASMQMSMASLGGGGRTHSGWETAFSGFTPASQKLRKKARVFSGPGKERVS